MGGPRETWAVSKQGLPWGRGGGLPPCGLLGGTFEEGATCGSAETQQLSVLPVPGGGKGKASCIIFQVGNEMMDRQRGGTGLGLSPSSNSDNLL